MFERHMDTRDSWSANFKTLMLMHRALQNIEINKALNARIKRNFHHIRAYASVDTDLEKYVELSAKYVMYLELYMEVCSRSDLLTDPERMTPAEIGKMDTSELIGNY